jgi:hypothetical protein
MLATKKRRRLGLDRHLQHVPREATHESDHRRFLGLCRRAPVQQAVDFFLQADARWYSLHGVDLLRPRYQRGSLVWSPGGYQRLFAFTGSLGRHLDRHAFVQGLEEANLRRWIPDRRCPKERLWSDIDGHDPVAGRSGSVDVHRAVKLDFERQGGVRARPCPKALLDGRSCRS